MLQHGKTPSQNRCLKLHVSCRVWAPAPHLHVDVISNRLGARSAARQGIHDEPPNPDAVRPAKANELFAKLAETSDGAVKTREKLFAELKAELELHASLEEQHLFPVLRRNAETKELVADAIRDNKELRAKLAELDAPAEERRGFPERLKELQKAFRQHARDDKRELLPAVQRALSEEQVQGVTEKMEAGLAEAEQAKQDEAEERRAKARQEREEAELRARQAECGQAGAGGRRTPHP